MTDFAPSEEFQLLCDVPTCPAQLSMVADVPRSEHGWGRLSVYDDATASDYDLCPVHYQAVLGILR